MKKISMFIGIMSVIAIVSCKEKQEEPITTTTTQTIEVAKDSVPLEKKTDGTSVSIGKDGIDVSTKNGENKTNVKISGGEAKVEIKK